MKFDFLKINLFFAFLFLSSAMAFLRPEKTFRAGLTNLRVLGQADADALIKQAVKKIGMDRKVATELGKLEKVTAVLGYGSPAPGINAVRFSAQFKRAGGLASVKIKSNDATGAASRGTSVGQVSCKSENGVITQISIAKDGGWGRFLEVAC